MVMGVWVVREKMLEKRFAAVPIQTFTADGGADGSVSIADTSLFKVKQRVIVMATGQDNQELEVKKVSNSTTMILGPITGAINTFTDLSAFTLVASAVVSANEQRRPTIIADDFERATYEEEPTVAKRTILVDEFGNKFTSDNPFPTSAVVNLGDITVGTVGQGDPNTLANGWPVKVTDGTFVLGTSIHPIKVDPTGTTPQPVSGPLTNTQFRSSDATRTTVDADIVDQLILASSASRRGVTIFNDSSTGTLYLGFGSVATSLIDFSIIVGPGGFYDVPNGYTGDIHGIWNATVGKARITEFV